MLLQQGHPNVLARQQQRKHCAGGPATDNATRCLLDIADRARRRRGVFDSHTQHSFFID
jgi:hypothetical protein